jgi:hypothetical protein
MKGPGLILLILLLFSSCAFAASLGKLEVQVPNAKCKIYIDNKLMGQGRMIVKLKPGAHKIKAFDGKKMIYNDTKIIVAGKYLAIKAYPAVAAKKGATPTTEALATPESIANPFLSPFTSESSAVAPVVTAEPVAAIPPENNQANGFNAEYYGSIQGYPECPDFQSGIGASLGLDCGWRNGLRGDISVSSFNGNSKNSGISEGTLGISSLDLGILCKFDEVRLIGLDLSGFYAGFGLGYYDFTHDPSDKVSKQYSSINYTYEDSIANNWGFYSKFGYRFVYSNWRFDCGIKSAIVNTIASSAITNTITKAETDDSISYSLPITTIYFGLVF